MTEVDPRQIQWLPLDALVDDPQNPKAHADDQIDASMGRHGVIDLITRDDRTGYIVSGHGRTKALRTQHARGDTPPEGVRVDGDGTWLVPVVTGWASTDDLDAAAVLIKLNRLTELGGWVDESLLALLDDLRDTDQFTDVGFTQHDLEILQRAVEAEGVFTHGVEGMLDEFRGISGQDGTDYAPEYAKKVTVYLRDDAAIQEFRDRLAIPDDLGPRLHYPLGWAPYDRRQTWQQERTGEGGVDA